MHFARISFGVVFVALASAANVAASNNRLIGDDAARANLIRREVPAYASGQNLDENEEEGHTGKQRGVSDPTMSTNSTNNASDTGSVNTTRSNKQYEHAQIHTEMHAQLKNREMKVERQARWAEKLERHEQNLAPPVNDLVARLDAGTIVGVNGWEGAVTVGAELSASHHIKWGQNDRTVVVTPTNCLRVASAAPNDARYLTYAPQKSTLAQLPTAGAFKYVISGSFSGCAYKCYGRPNPDADIVCAHIARDATGTQGQREENVLAITDYARQKGWVELHNQVDTAGIAGPLAGNGVDAIWVVSQVVGGTVHTIRIHLSDTGGIVGKSAIFASALHYNAVAGTWQ